MDLVDRLTAEPELREQFQDFAARYAQDPGGEKITDLEASEWYDKVAGQLGRGHFCAAARDAIAALPEDGRRRFMTLLQEACARDGYALGWDGVTSDPQPLAELLCQLQERGPGRLGDLLGGGSGGHAARSDANASEPMVRAVVGGVAARGGARLLEER